MGRVSLGEVWDGSENPRRGLRRVGGPLWGSGMGRVYLGEVWDGSWNHPEFLDG